MFICIIASANLSPYCLLLPLRFLPCRCPLRGTHITWTLAIQVREQLRRELSRLQFVGIEAPIVFRENQALAMIQVCPCGTFEPRLLATHDIFEVELVDILRTIRALSIRAKVLPEQHMLTIRMTLL